MPRTALFRPAAPATQAHNVGKTALQCVVVWSLTLGLFPALVLLAERAAGVRGFDFVGRRAVAAGLFVAFSALNVTTGAVLAGRGRGTPLPLDCPRDLVTSGPYAYVRNPMAVAGLGQGLGVALWLGSWSVIAYVLAGVALWQWGARPAEERDLEARFGATFAAYRAAVRCWLPRTSAYVAERTTREARA